MGRIGVVLLVSLLLLGPLAATPPVHSSVHTSEYVDELGDGGHSVGTTTAERHSTQTTNRSELEPGAQFVGVVGAHQERHTGEVDAQVVAVRLAKADSPEQKAQLIDEIHHQHERRLDTLAADRREFRHAYENRSMSQSEYRARAARIDVEIRGIERIAVQLGNEAQGVSLTLLLGAGIDRLTITELETRARSLQGSELAVIAPSFAREPNQSDTGQDDDIRDGGSPETPTDTTVNTTLTEADTEVRIARERVDEATQAVEETLVSSTVSALLADARQNLSTAEQRLTAARRARDNGNDQRAIELAQEAIHFAQQATNQAETVIEMVTSETG